MLNWQKQIHSSPLERDSVYTNIHVDRQDRYNNRRSIDTWEEAGNSIYVDSAST